MALVVTPGASNADSYADIAALDAYHVARGNAAWGAATNGNKETAARRATGWLDAAYDGRWEGYRINGRSQPLAWPRLGACDAEGYSIDSTTIPAEVVAATCEAALRELASPGSLSPDVVTGTIAKRKKVGPLEVEYANPSGATAMTPTLTIVDGILARLLTNTGGGASVDLVRV